MDVGMSLWLPGGELGEYRWVKEQREMVDTVLEVGAVRYEMLEAMQSWRLTMDGEVQARPCVRGETTTHPVPVALDVRFDALTPAIGTDGQPSGGPRSAEAAAAAGTVGKGHLEQAGRWTGSLEVDGTRHEWLGAHGNRDRSWGPRRWGGPKMWRWFSINVGDDMHFGGIRLGTDAGDLHRGWVWDGDARPPRSPSGACRTELADDGVTHTVVHLDVVDKRGRTYPLRGDVLRVADIGRAGGTLVNEGLARWTYEDPDGATAHRLRHLRVPPPARRRREACRPRRVGRWQPRPEQRGAGGRARRVSSAAPCATCGGCRAAPRGSPARSTSSTPDGATRPLILQMERGGGAARARVRMERALLVRRGAAGVPVPAVVAVGSARRRSGPGWLVVERLEGETIPRKILRDAEWAAARAALTGAVRHARWPPSTRSTRRPIAGLPPADPLGDPLPFLDALGEVRPALELGVRWLAAHRPPAGRPGHGARRLPPRATSSSAPTACVACSTGSWPTPATRPRTSAGCARRPGASAGRGEVGGFGALRRAARRVRRRRAARRWRPTGCTGGRSTRRSSGR